MRVLRWVAIIAGVYVVVALTLDGMIAYFQPTGGGTGVLRTFDEQGQPHERVLGILDDGGTLWVESGHHFRGWYNRLRHNPDVELVRDGEVRAYRAVAVDTPEAERRIKQLMWEGAGPVGYWLGRALLLFAEIKPVRLDPRQAPGAAPSDGRRPL